MQAVGSGVFGQALPPVRLGRPRRLGPDRPGRHLPRPADPEGRGADDRVPEHDHGRLDSTDDPGREDQAQRVLAGRRRSRRPRRRPLPVRRAGDGRSSTSTASASAVAAGGSRAGSYAWYARGKKPGEYRLALAAQDRAGNIGPSTREFTVRLRYVELFKRRFTPRGRTHSRASLVRRETAHVEAREPGSGTGRAPAPEDPRADAAGAIHAHGVRERSPGAGNRHRPKQRSLTCSGSCRSPHRSNARSPTLRRSCSPPASCSRSPGASCGAGSASCAGRSSR